MTDIKKLNDIIKESGLKKTYIAEQLGISKASFGAKANGKGEFKVREVIVLCKILGIRSLQKKEDIFFSFSNSVDE